jgi:hypothetical protein
MHSESVGLGARFMMHAISPIEVVGFATSPQKLEQSDSTNREFAPGEVRFDSLLDLVKRETELTPRTDVEPRADSG